MLTTYAASQQDRPQPKCLDLVCCTWGFGCSRITWPVAVYDAENVAEEKAVKLEQRAEQALAAREAIPGVPPPASIKDEMCKMFYWTAIPHDNESYDVTRGWDSVIRKDQNHLAMMSEHCHL